MAPRSLLADLPVDASAQLLVTEKIADSAGRVARATETLALIQRARTEPSPPSVDERALPSDLRRPITLNWSGLGEGAARQVANLLGYDFWVVGNSPAVSPPVHVGAEAGPAAKVLEDIGLQVQGSAQVVVDPNIRRVEYRYIAQNPLLGPRIRGAAPPLRRVTK